MSLGPDYSLVGSALGLSRDPTALTTSEGSLLIVNAAYRDRFGGIVRRSRSAMDDEARQGLELASTMAWRDGAGCVAGIATERGRRSRSRSSGSARMATFCCGASPIRRRPTR